MKDTVDLNIWIELSEKAYAENIRFFRTIVGDTVELSVVIKSNAYGHGWLPVAQMAASHGADSYCVQTLDEALALRRAGFHQDVLIMGSIANNAVGEAVRNSFRIAICSRESLRDLVESIKGLSQIARVHLKMETGFYRQGLDRKELLWCLDEIKRTPTISVEGAYSHLSTSDDMNSDTYTDCQIKRFKRMVGVIETSGFHGVKKHIAGSAAALRFPGAYFDMVRLGIGQYGLWPSKESALLYKVGNRWGGVEPIKPVLSWKCRITQVKKVPAGSFIGYGASYKAMRNMRIGILPVGYADGYSRHLSNRGLVLVQGKRVPVVGRVCMNLTMVDVTNVPYVRPGEEVVLVGRQGEDAITTDDVAALLGTINYEVVTRINWQIPRIVIPWNHVSEQADIRWRS